MLAHNRLGPIRDGDGCAKACRDYERIERDILPAMRLSDEAHKSQVGRGKELESALSVRNLALLGRLLGTAALKREESRGAHYRLDYPDQDDQNWRVVTRLRRDKSGEIDFSADPVKSHAL